MANLACYSAVLFGPFWVFAMQFALVDFQRQPPQPKLKGLCLSCWQPLQSKCGPKVVWHWAHVSKKHCDPWWENETEWHRSWKALFPADQQEVVQYDSVTGEKHIADVKTAAGVVIELQHSAMPLEELRAREAFYKQMIWIVDARPFAAQFKLIPQPLPDPKSEMCRDMVFACSALLFWRPSEVMEGYALVEHHRTEKVQDEILANYRGHHFFKWTRPRTVWYDASAPVFLDFGTTELLHLQPYNRPGIYCIQRVSKQALIQRHGGAFRT